MHSEILNKPVMVMGGGAVGRSLAADLSLTGYKVHLYEHPDFEENIQKIRETHEIRLGGEQYNFRWFKRVGVARIDVVTTDISEALEDVRLILVGIPGAGHQAHFEKLIPGLKDGHIVSIFPDNFGSLLFREMLHRKGRDVAVVVGGWITAPYSARIYEREGNSVECIARPKKLMADTLPSKDRAKFMGLLRGLPIFDGTQYIEEADTILGPGLWNPNPIVHTVACVLNTGAIENAGRGDKIFGDPEAGYSMYRDGMSPAVSRVQMEYYKEQCAIAKEIGIKIVEYTEEQFMRKCSVMADAFAAPYIEEFCPPIVGPATVQARYFTEDIPIGTNVYYQLGQKFGIETPVIESIIRLGSIICDTNFFETGRSLKELGIADMSKSELLKYLRGE